MKPIVHVYLKMIKRKISPLNIITWLTKTSSFARIVWFYWGSNILVNVRQNKMHLSFSCKLQNAYSRSFFVGFFLNSVLSVSELYFFDIYMIYIYIFNTKLDESRLETYFLKTESIRFFRIYFELNFDVFDLNILQWVYHTASVG